VTSLASRRRLLAVLLVCASLPLTAASHGGDSINAHDLREWLTYIASDDLQGRAVFSAGLGLAASYIEQHLREWNVKPAGDNGSYLQTVKVLGVRTTSRSSVTVQVGDERRTFADGEGVRFPRQAGGKQHLEIGRVEFAGYGLDLPAQRHDDYRGKDMTGAAAIWLGPAGIDGLDQAANRLLLDGRGRFATEEKHAAASVGVARAGGGARGEAAGRGQTPREDEAAAPEPQRRGRGRGAMPPADFTTTERFDRIVPPAITADEAFFTFLFSRAPVKYDELKRRADARQPLSPFRLDGVRITFDVNVEYEVVRTRLTQNVVAMVEGSDPQLRQTYVALGAHYDHVGYGEGELVKRENGVRRASAPGRVTPGAENDRIWNGADDDGSGTVALMALARAFAAGPRPKRSVLFVWHAGEEFGRWGSLYFVENPTVPIDRIVAQLNIDMVGRNRDNKSSEANTVYLVGADRISSELDAISREANHALPNPMRLDYEFNETADPEQLYFRSDHYSYASKGIPVIFFTTGLHADYHANTDEVSRIEFDKLTHVSRLVYEIAARLGSLDHAPARDNRGPRTAKDALATTR